jgi:hypothetical protein
VDDRHAAVEGLGNPGGAERGVVTANGEEIGDVEPAQRFDDVLQRLRRPGGVGAGGAQDGAALEVNLRDPGDVQLVHSREVPLHEPPEAGFAAEHPEPLVPGLDGRRRDDRVDARRRAAAHQDSQRLHQSGYATTCSISGAYRPERARLLSRARC